MTQRQKHDDLVTVLLSNSVKGLAHYRWIIANKFITWRADGTCMLSDKGMQKLRNYERFCKSKG